MYGTIEAFAKYLVSIKTEYKGEYVAPIGHEIRVHNRTVSRIIVQNTDVTVIFAEATENQSFIHSLFDTTVTEWSLWKLTPVV
jgi:hypothetical protein